MGGSRRRRVVAVVVVVGACFALLPACGVVSVSQPDTDSTTSTLFAPGGEAIAVGGAPLSTTTLLHGVTPGPTLTTPGMPGMPGDPTVPSTTLPLGLPMPGTPNYLDTWGEYQRQLEAAAKVGTGTGAPGLSTVIVPVQSDYCTAVRRMLVVSEGVFTILINSNFEQRRTVLKTQVEAVLEFAHAVGGEVEQTIENFFVGFPEHLDALEPDDLVGMRELVALAVRTATPIVNSAQRECRVPASQPGHVGPDRPMTDEEIDGYLGG